MPVNISIKNVPDDLVSQLKQRASANHRSMQGEVLAILEAAVRRPAVMTSTELADILAKVRAIGHPNAAESVQIIRDYRDHGTP